MLLEKLYKADISIASAGNNTIIAAPSGSGEYLAIDHINLIASGGNTVQLKTGSTSYGGAFALATSVPLVLDNATQNQDGVITCGVNEAFVINITGAVQVSGFVRYRIINR